jgi:hypothetical protein
MATYGKYDVIAYPSFYAVTDMTTHDIVATRTDRIKAHRLARKMDRQSKSARHARKPEKDNAS